MAPFYLHCRFQLCRSVHSALAVDALIVNFTYLSLCFIERVTQSNVHIFML